jgi:transposase-like protein
MKKSRHTTVQIVSKLREAEKLLAEGATVGQACKKLGITDQTYYRWKKKYSGFDENEAKRLRELEKENARLKKIVAEQTMDIDSLKELLKKKL